MRSKDAISGYLFILPFIIGFLAFFLMPVIQSISFSLSDMHMDQYQYSLSWAGLSHYKRALFIDTNFRQVLVSSIKDMVTQVPVILVFSFFMASILNQKFKGRAFARAVLFLPVIITAGVILGLEKSDLLVSASYDVVNGVAGSEMSDFQKLFDLERFISTYTNLGGPVVTFISDAVGGIYDIIIASGVQILIFLAGLQSISPSLYEASRIEGATAWESFWKITFPMISSLIVVNVVYTVVDCFVKETNQMMELINDTIFSSVQYGLGSAMAWIYFSIVGVILAVVGLLISRKVFYYD